MDDINNLYLSIINNFSTNFVLFLEHRQFLDLNDSLRESIKKWVI